MSCYFGNVRKKNAPVCNFLTNILLLFQTINLVYKINKVECQLLYLKGNRLFFKFVTLTTIYFLVPKQLQPQFYKSL